MSATGTCVKCGNELPAGALACGRCGQTVSRLSYLLKPLDRPDLEADIPAAPAWPTPAPPAVPLPSASPAAASSRPASAVPPPGTAADATAGPVYRPPARPLLRNRADEDLLAGAYASWIRRVFAYLIDACVLTLLARLLLPLLSEQLYAVSNGKLYTLSYPTLVGLVILYFVPVAYFGLLESSPLQASLGKLAVGVYVTDDQGDRPSFVQAASRYFGKMLSVWSLVGLIGYLMPLWTRRRKALHDMMAATVVLRGRASERPLREKQPQPDRVVGWAILGMLLLFLLVIGTYLLVHSTLGFHHQPPPGYSPLSSS